MILKIDRKDRTTTFISSDEINSQTKEVIDENGKKLFCYSFFKNNLSVIAARIYSLNSFDYAYQTNVYNRDRLEIPEGYYEISLKNFHPMEEDLPNYILAQRRVSKHWSLEKPTWENIRGRDFPSENIALLTKSKSNIQNYEIGVAYLLNDNGKTIEIFR